MAFMAEAALASGCGSYAQSTRRRMKVSDFPWYCAQHHPGKQALTKQHLQMQGFRVAFPDMLNPNPRAGYTTRVPVRIPLFPGYVFISFDKYHDPWQRIFSTLGIKRMFVTPDGEPVLLPKQDAARIMDGSILAPEVLVEYFPLEAFSPGDEVRLEEGAYHGFPGTVTAFHSASRRIELLVHIFGRSTKLITDAAKVIKQV